LEGKYYSLGEEITEETYEKVLSSADDLHSLENFLERLEEAVRRYLNCEY
jgi:hypothetical protein